MLKISLDFKYRVKFSTQFKKNYKKIKKQGKDISKLKYVIERLANEELLDVKYKDHALNDNKKYKNCRECHIESDWLLVYKIINNELILILIDTGSHSELF